MPLQATSGAASYDAFGGGVPVVPAYIEDVFSTYLLTGTGASQTITNGIDISTNGGLVWSKSRSAIQDHSLIDTVRGNGSILYSNLSSAADTGVTTGITAFNTTGYALGSGSFINQNAATYASWTFREQPKFFDIVTYSGNSTAGREIAHNLGSTPGCIIVKRLNQAEDWIVYHRGVSDSLLRLNTTDANAAANAKYYWGNNTTFIAPTSTVFTVATDSSINQTGGTYVAYLFAHNAGGFGLTGTDNVISCGSGTVGTEVNLGYEPQFVIMKRTTLAGQWYMLDNMRGWNVAGDDQYVSASSAGAESAGDYGYPTATGFYPTGFGSTGNDFIYIAIRRGPMQIPTVGTSVFSPNNTSVASGSSKITTTFPVDSTLTKGVPWTFNDRLRGAGKLLFIRTGSETSGTASDWQLDFNNGYEVGADDIGPIKPSYAFRRAPSFFDEVCYTGTGSGTNQTISHNLGVTPQIVIMKARVADSGNSNGYWATAVTTAPSGQEAFYLNTSDYGQAYSIFGSGFAVTSTTFTTPIYWNTSAKTYVAYLFATCAGVSKVGSYTGTGSSQVIDCGFTTGARWVMIKRTDSTGDWYVWDTARGMVSGTDPYLLLNSESNEVATLGSVTTVTTGFALDSTILAAINVSGGTYIFLAIA